MALLVACRCYGKTPSVYSTAKQEQEPKGWAPLTRPVEASQARCEQEGVWPQEGNARCQSTNHLPASPSNLCVSGYCVDLLLQPSESSSASLGLFLPHSRREPSILHTLKCCPSLSLGVEHSSAFVSHEGVAQCCSVARNLKPTINNTTDKKSETSSQELPAFPRYLRSLWQRLGSTGLLSTAALWP